MEPLNLSGVPRHVDLAFEDSERVDALINKYFDDA